MEKLEVNIKSIELGFRYKVGDSIFIRYIINGNQIEHIRVSVECHNLVSNTIIGETDEFINGFKIVKLLNKQYAYVRESDNVLLPYRFDIASQFNEEGIAIVAKDGIVTRIDKEFNIVDENKIMVKKRQ